MSIFNELILPKIFAISNKYVKSINEELKAALESLDKFEEGLKDGRATLRERTLKERNALTTLQSISEDDDNKATEKPGISEECTSIDSGKEKRGPKKRSKNEVDDMSSPGQDKRLKRNAHVKAQSIIRQQVNEMLTQKLGREDSTVRKGHRRKDDDKEYEPMPAVRIKEDKISTSPRPEPVQIQLPLHIVVKEEPNNDDIYMPPPACPVPKLRKATQKVKCDTAEGETKKRSTRSKKVTAEPLRASTRLTRASSRTARLEEEIPPPPAAVPRPKRSRAKKTTLETSEENQNIQDSSIASPADKRPKGTRRRQKASEKQEEPVEVIDIVSPKDEIISVSVIPDLPTSKSHLDQLNSPQPDSPILTTSKTHLNQLNSPQPDSPILTTNKTYLNRLNSHQPDSAILTTNKKNEIVDVKEKQKNANEIDSGIEETDGSDENKVPTQQSDRTRILANMDTTITISKDLDKIEVLSNGHNHADLPKAKMNETTVIEKNTGKQIMNATVVLDKGSNLHADNSLLTDDESIEDTTPPRQPLPQPTSAVKEKVQQFEEMATRVTRTKTRALAKKEEVTENQTPPDKVIKPTPVAPETLTKMNNLIFKGNVSQVHSSASKLTANTSLMKSQIPTSTSKLSAFNRAREAAEEQKREKEDARKKKEALMDAKREFNRKKREEKMAAAAAARVAVERERQALLAAAARDRHEKQMHADVTKQEKLKEVERKKLEYARKVAETEERRRAEETARLNRLEEEQRKAEEKRRQQEEAELKAKKEAALINREMERRHKEFQEKMKMKMRKKMELEKMSTPQKIRIPPKYMENGFQYLNSDEEAEPVKRPEPEWSTSKNRHQSAKAFDLIETSLIDQMFSVKEQTIDLRVVFPGIDRAKLKRTSSAVWRTPPHRLNTLNEEW